MHSVTKLCDMYSDKSEGSQPEIGFRVNDVTAIQERSKSGSNESFVEVKEKHDELQPQFNSW